MAHGRRREAWDHTAAVITWLAALAGNQVDPSTLNPYRPRPVVVKSPEQIETENRAAWRALGRGLREIKNGSRRK